MKIYPILNKMISYVNRQIEKLPSDELNHIKNKIMLRNQNNLAAFFDLIKVQISFFELLKIDFKVQYSKAPKQP